MLKKVVELPHTDAQARAHTRAMWGGTRQQKPIVDEEGTHAGGRAHTRPMYKHHIRSPGDGQRHWLVNLTKHWGRPTDRGRLSMYACALWALQMPLILGAYHLTPRPQQKHYLQRGGGGAWAWGGTAEDLRPSLKACS